MTIGCIVRIAIPASKTLGWQARRYVGVCRDPRTQREKTVYLSRFYADRKYGGSDRARRRADAWLTALTAPS